MKNSINNYFLNLKNTIDNIDISDIEQFINILINAREQGNTIFIAGNGGSATTAAHIACDFNKEIISKDNKRFKFVCLNSNQATITAYSNDISFDDVFIEQLKNFLQSKDVLIVISGSGNSVNLIKAVDYANKTGAITVSITGYDGGKLKNISHCNINANINDMQIAQDIHLAVCHLAMQTIIKEDYKDVPMVLSRSLIDD